MIYTLQPTNTIFDTDVDLPTLDAGKKIGIFLSGGMESTLLVKLAINKYGKDNVLCFYSDDIFTAKNETKKKYIEANIQNAEKNLDVSVIYVDFDYDDFIKNRKQNILDKIQFLTDTYGTQYQLFGFTKLFFEVEPFKQDNITVQDVYDIAYSDKERYKSTIEEFHLPTKVYATKLLEVDIPPEVYVTLREVNGVIRSPLRNLNKSEVVDLYRQLNLLDLLYSTTSCIQHTYYETKKHCGECFNCQQRSDAFSILNDPTVQDQTPYLSDAILTRRQELNEKMNNGLY
jgi:7-cyano-7-deazaguanine synthase in queuosine biosynthesis